MPDIAPFPPGRLEELCRSLGEVMTGTQLTRLLEQAGIADRSTESTKWKRLYQSVNRRHDGRPVIAILHAAMDPARFGRHRHGYEVHRQALNVTLAFAGLTLGPDGRVARLAAARTLGEAHERANTLRAHLERRDVHPDVLTFCRAELLQEDYFHAVLEAAKSVAQKRRVRTSASKASASLLGSVRDRIRPPSSRQRTLQLTPSAVSSRWTLTRAAAVLRGCPPHGTSMAHGTGRTSSSRKARQ